MLIESIQTSDAIKMSDCSTNINERVRYTANTGTAYISTANTSLTGSGTMVALLTTGATASSVGTLIKRITIKGRGNVTRGMVRIFYGDGEFFTRLIDEFDIWAVVQSSIADTFSVSFDVDWSFSPNLYISAATNNADGFVVTMEALDLTYP